MHWNYRVMALCSDEHVVEYNIHEVFYNEEENEVVVGAVIVDAKNKFGWSEYPSVVSSEEGKEGLQWQLNAMQSAIDKDIIYVNSDNEVLDGPPTRQ